MLCGSKIGDFLYQLAICKRYQADVYLYKNCKGKYPHLRNNFTMAMWQFVYPLVESFNIKWWDEKLHIDHDLNNFRNDLNLHKQHLMQSMQNVVDKVDAVYEPWITIEPKKVSPIVVTHSLARATKKKYSFLKPAIFLGLEKEWKVFNSRCEIDFYPVADALEMAEVMKGAELCVCNDSAPLVIGQAVECNIASNDNVMTMIPLQKL